MESQKPLGMQENAHDVKYLKAGRVQSCKRTEANVQKNLEMFTECSIFPLVCLVRVGKLRNQHGVEILLSCRQEYVVRNGVKGQMLSTLHPNLSRNSIAELHLNSSSRQNVYPKPLSITQPIVLTLHLREHDLPIFRTP